MFPEQPCGGFTRFGGFFFSFFSFSLFFSSFSFPFSPFFSLFFSFFQPFFPALFSQPFLTFFQPFFQPFSQQFLRSLFSLVPRFLCFRWGMRCWRLAPGWLCRWQAEGGLRVTGGRKWPYMFKVGLFYTVFLFIHHLVPLRLELLFPFLLLETFVSWRRQCVFYLFLYFCHVHGVYCVNTHRLWNRDE